MGLMDSLRRAEEEGKSLARRGMEKARTSMDDAERMMRRKMRVHPRSTPAANVGATRATNDQTPDPATGGIVSIHGRDVDPAELDKTAA